jgi:outer membrane protein W
MSTFKTMVAILAMGLPITAVAQTTGQADSHALSGRHQIEVSIGLLSGLGTSAEVSVGDVSMTSDANGIIGSIAYAYWLTDEWAVNLSLGVASADASISASGTGGSVESATVIPLLFGAKYEPLKLAIGDALRPYAYASIGPYFGFASDVRVGTTTGTESYSETALGSRAGLGMDLSLSRSFTLGLAVGYRLVSDFGRRIGSEENHSSPEFALSFGIVFGGGRQ